ncbi:hypothetical protein AB205_0015330 [Aquarana catesbeiana]|uniref:Uncharacterized protein n=1 Tax=Aquarana catesbeiana TaxID=8400 RepID=A0A2G9P7A3_AQUCT|nr:hypothetical protein AB205_0015330 [Aquarana catesbeiana]
MQIFQYLVDAVTSRFIIFLRNTIFVRNSEEVLKGREREKDPYNSCNKKLGQEVTEHFVKPKKQNSICCSLPSLKV